MDLTRRWVKSLVDVRPGERLPAFLMFTYGFLVLTSYYVVKPVRNSVFVDRVGADNLPWVYILTAIVVTVVMIGYSRYVDRIKEIVLLLGTFAFLAVNLVFFRWWLGLGDAVVSSGTFYVWGKLYPLLLVSQFFLVANLVFTTRQARRLFGPIGVGLILGAIAGGTVSGFAASIVGTENLLLVAAGILGLAAGLVLSLARHIEGGRGASGRLVEDVSGDAWKILKGSGHLRTIAVILGLTIIVGTLIDWQFNSAVEEFIQGEDAKTAFFGKFFAGLNIASVLIQVLITGFVLRQFGVGVGMLALPIGLLVATAGVALLPLLLTAALAKGAEGALRYSLDQSTRELLYLPVPTESKYKVKPLIDLAVYRGGTGLGGVLLLVLVNVLDLPWEATVRLVAGLSALCIALWIWTTIRMRGEFRSSIQRLIGVRDVEVDELILSRLDAGTREALVRTLREGDADRVLFALSLLEYDLDESSLREVARLSGHDAPEVRARALEILHEAGTAEFTGTVEGLVDDPSLEVRVRAIRYLCENGAEPAAERLRTFLDYDDSAVRVAATACVLRYGGLDDAHLARETLEALAVSDETKARQSAARLLATVERPDESQLGLLERLMEDEAKGVRHEAIRAAGAGRVRATLTHLVDLLGDPEDREAAREALARFGPAARGTLLDYLRDPRTPLAVLRVLPTLLTTEPDQEVADEMLASYPDLPAPARFEIVRALNKARRTGAELEFDPDRLLELAERETKEAYRWVVPYHALGGSEDGTGLLAKTLRQRWLEAAERASRLAGLEHPMGELYAAFSGIASEREARRQQGYELLENTLPRRFRALFDPLLDPDRTLEEIAAEAAERYGFEVATRAATLKRLSEDGGAWISLLARREMMPTAARERAVDAGRLAWRPGVPETAWRQRPAEDPKEESRMNIVERAEALSRSALFRELRSEDLAAVASLAEERSFEKDEVVFGEGAEGGDLYVVLSGGIAGRRGDRTLFVAEPGRAVGELSLLDGGPREYTATAVTATKALVLDRSSLVRVMEERFPVVRGVIAHLSRLARRGPDREVIGSSGSEHGEEVAR